MKKVSIIIPVYNVENFIKQALDSVANQTLKDIEIICIDDCSTDNSYEILKDYASKDDRFVVLKQETNQGQGVARNRALDIATGEYIMFLDPDDWYELDACEKAYNKISSDNSDVCFFGYSTYDERSNKTSKYIKYLSTLKKYEKKCLDVSKDDVPYMGYTWTKIYKHEFLKTHNCKFAEGRTCEDNPFTVSSTAYAKSVSFIPDILYIHRKYSSPGRKDAIAQRRKDWKYAFDNRKMAYDIIMSVNNLGVFKQHFLVHYANCLIEAFDSYSKSLESKEEIYQKVHEYIKALCDDNKISDFKQRFKYYQRLNIFAKNNNYNSYLKDDKIYRQKNEFKKSIINFKNRIMNFFKKK